MNVPSLHEVDGPLTREMLLEPARFGLGHLPAARRPDAVAATVCGYCATGCGLDVHLQDGVAVGLSPRTEYPVNLGMACPKGWESLAVLDAPDRATTPLLRDASGDLKPVDWPRAIEAFCLGMKGVLVRHGPHSVAFLGTGQMVTEETAFFGALAKFGMGLRHGDSNTRQCMATAAVAYKQSFGFDAPPYTYADFEESDVLVFVGSNLCLAHPILWERVMRNRRKPKIIVIDPRRTETAMAAALHLPVAPKSDIVLLYGAARELIRRGAIDSSFINRHTQGFEGFAEFAATFTPEVVCAETGLPPELYAEFLGAIARQERVSYWWTMGVNQSHQGVRTAQAIINLSLLTGGLGKPGAGANSITGQCNAMGSRLFANTTGLPGGRDFANPQDRREVAEILGINVACIPHDAGWAYPEIMEGVRSGAIRGLWIACTNTAHSWINQSDARELLSKLEFLVVQDMYTTADTARWAHLVLPAAGWGEKDGTFINSERRIGPVAKVARAPGQALSDFAIFRLIADAWGCGEMFREWTSPAAAFQVLKRLSAGRPCDFTGIRDAEHLRRRGGIQWPRPEGAPQPAAERRLFEDGRFFHADGRARFLYEAPRPLPEPPDEEFPLLLLTGRGSASQWHTQTRTGKSAVLRKLYPAAVYVEINPEDALELGVRPQSKVYVESPRGRIEATAVVTPTIPRGQVFVPMHYEETNRLTVSAFDPSSRQPAYKASAVRVTPV